MALAALQLPIALASGMIGWLIIWGDNEEPALQFATYVGVVGLPSVVAVPLGFHALIRRTTGWDATLGAAGAACGV